MTLLFPDFSYLIQVVNVGFVMEVVTFSHSSSIFLAPAPFYGS